VSELAKELGTELVDATEIEAMEVLQAVEEMDEEFYDEQMEEMPATFKYCGVYTTASDKGMIAASR
jgi:hypothetical protein